MRIWTGAKVHPQALRARDSLKTGGAMRQGPSRAKAKGHEEEPAVGSADLMDANLYGLEQ